MKTCFVSALALVGVIGAAVTATDCDLTSIRGVLEANTTVAPKLKTAEDGCIEDSDIDIFDVTNFPTKAQALQAQESEDCSDLINLVNSNANINTQCTLLVNGTTVIYGRLISDFLDGKTGNESESDSGSSEASESESDSKSKSASKSGSSSTSTSGSANTALSFVTYITVAAIAAALR